MPFFYIHAGTRTLGFDPLSVLSLPYRRKGRLHVKGLQRRDGLRVQFSSVLYVQYWWWVGEFHFNGHGILNNLTFHRYNCGRCHTSDFSAKTFQQWHFFSSEYLNVAESAEETMSHLYS